jgi:hypothetical protein
LGWPRTRPASSRTLPLEDALQLVHLYFERGSPNPGRDLPQVPPRQPRLLEPPSPVTLALLWRQHRRRPTACLALRQRPRDAMRVLAPHRKLEAFAAVLALDLNGRPDALNEGYRRRDSPVPAKRGEDGGVTSGCRENLDRHWLVSDRAGVDRSATWCALARHLEPFENRGPALGVLAYPPEGATCAYSRPDGKRLACRSPLDIAVGEPKDQDRRVGHAKTVPEPADDGLLRFSCVDTLNVDDLDVLLRDLSDQPKQALPAKLLADRRDRTSSEVVLEVAVRKADHERPGGDKAPLCSLRPRVPELSGPQTLRIPVHLSGDKPLAHPPLVLLQEHGAELRECVRSRIVERPEDALAVVDGERYYGSTERERLLEHASRRIVDKAGELPHVVIGNPKTGEHHARDSASEEGSPSGTNSGPDRSRRGPLLESCAAMPLATRRLDRRNDGPS